MTERLVATLPKSRREELRVSVAETHGRRHVRVRAYFEHNGEWRPGKQGFDVRVEAVPGLLDALGKAVQA